MNGTTKAYALASLTVLIWGTTFVATKQLQQYYNPVELILYRFVIAYLLFWVIKPKPLKLASQKDNVLFAAAGLTGVCLYFVSESLAISLTEASIVGVLVSVSPIFAALITSFILKERQLTKKFSIGLVLAFVGISLVSLRDTSFAHISWLGSLLAIFSAFMWSIYSILSNRISRTYDDVILYTRRTLFFGIIFVGLYQVFFGQTTWVVPPVDGIFYLAYLGMGASALCFFMWNYALRVLGAAKTCIFIYLLPVIAMVASAIVLGEIITPLMMVGAACALLGLYLCES